MDYIKLIKQRENISMRINDMLASDDFDLSIRYLTTIHEILFKGILFENGHFRKDNLSKDEVILNGDTVKYPDYHTIVSYLKFTIFDEKKIDYDKLNIEDVIYNIANFTAKIWLIHPFYEGNTRTTCVFVEKYLKSLERSF